RIVGNRTAGWLWKTASRNLDSVQVSHKSVVVVNSQDQPLNRLRAEDCELLPKKNGEILQRKINKRRSRSVTRITKTGLARDPARVIKTNLAPRGDGSGSFVGALQITPGFADSDQGHFI